MAKLSEQRFSDYTLKMLRILNDAGNRSRLLRFFCVHEAWRAGDCQESRLLWGMVSARGELPLYLGALLNAQVFPVGCLRNTSQRIDTVD